MKKCDAAKATIGKTRRQFIPKEDALPTKTRRPSIVRAKTLDIALNLVNQANFHRAEDRDWFKEHVRLSFGVEVEAKQNNKKDRFGRKRWRFFARGQAKATSTELEVASSTSKHRQAKLTDAVDAMVEMVNSAKSPEAVLDLYVAKSAAIAKRGADYARAWQKAVHLRLRKLGSEAAHFEALEREAEKSWKAMDAYEELLVEGREKFQNEEAPFEVSDQAHSVEAQARLVRELSERYGVKNPVSKEEALVLMDQYGTIEEALKALEKIGVKPRSGRRGAWPVKGKNNGRRLNDLFDRKVETVEIRESAGYGSKVKPKQKGDILPVRNGTVEIVDVKWVPNVKPQKDWRSTKETWRGQRSEFVYTVRLTKASSYQVYYKKDGFTYYIVEPMNADNMIFTMRSGAADRIAASEIVKKQTPMDLATAQHFLEGVPYGTQTQLEIVPSEVTRPSVESQLGPGKRSQPTIDNEIDKDLARQGGSRAERGKPKSQPPATSIGGRPGGPDVDQFGKKIVDEAYGLTNARAPEYEGDWKPNENLTWRNDMEAPAGQIHETDIETGEKLYVVRFRKNNGIRIWKMKDWYADGPTATEHQVFTPVPGVKEHMKLQAGIQLIDRASTFEETVAIYTGLLEAASQGGWLMGLERVTVGRLSELGYVPGDVMKYLRQRDVRRAMELGLEPPTGDVDSVMPMRFEPTQRGYYKETKEQEVQTMRYNERHNEHLKVQAEIKANRILWDHGELLMFESKGHEGFIMTPDGVYELIAVTELSEETGQTMTVLYEAKVENEIGPDGVRNGLQLYRHVGTDMSSGSLSSPSTSKATDVLESKWRKTLEGKENESLAQKAQLVDAVVEELVKSNPARAELLQTPDGRLKLREVALSVLEARGKESGVSAREAALLFHEYSSLNVASKNNSSLMENLYDEEMLAELGIESEAGQEYLDEHVDDYIDDMNGEGTLDVLCEGF